MTKTAGKISTIILTLLLFISCTERINITLDDSSVRLVVEGSVTTDTMVHSVILSKTTSYFNSQKAPYVSGASVSITDGERNVLLSENKPGVYQTDSTFYGIQGKSYTLNISLASPVGGYDEYSASSTMNKEVRLDSVNLVFHPEWSEAGFWEVLCFFQDPPTAEYYRFLISLNGKMLSDTLDDWFTSDDRFFNGGYISGASIAFFDQGEDNEKLKEGDEIAVELNSIGRDYAGFIWEAQSELWGSNPLFSGPPANVKGNISNGAIGYFAAYTTSRARIKVVNKGPGR